MEIKTNKQTNKQRMKSKVLREGFCVNSHLNPTRITTAFENYGRKQQNKNEAKTINKLQILLLHSRSINSLSYIRIQIPSQT